MTREEIMALELDQLETRSAELGEEAKTADMARLDEINAEFDVIEERRAQIEKANETRARAAKAVAEGAGDPVGPTPKEERKKMDVREIRNSQEYIDAFAKYIKTGKDMECRALLTEGANVQNSSGPVPVPTYIENRIRQAWENDEIMNRVRKTFVPGNLKVGFEISATDAVWHEEGTAEPVEEKIVLGIVNMVPKTIKKWITVSDEALALSNYDLLIYLYDEITYKIIKFAAEEVIEAYFAAPATSDATHVGVPIFTTAAAVPTTAEIIQAKALLGSEARNLVAICSRATEAAIKAAALNAPYAYDPFDGLEVLHTDKVELANGGMIIADLDGVHVNLPEGDGVRFKFDDLSLAEKDLVKIVGRMLAAIAITGPKMAVKLTDET